VGAAPPFLRPGQSWPLAPPLGPAHRPSRSARSLSPWPADVRGPRLPSLPRGAAVSAVSYLPPEWEGAFLLLAATVNQANRPIPSKFQHEINAKIHYKARRTHPGPLFHLISPVQAHHPVQNPSSTPSLGFPSPMICRRIKLTATLPYTVGVTSA
jgi:hypothetical protein